MRGGGIGRSHHADIKRQPQAVNESKKSIDWLRRIRQKIHRSDILFAIAFIGLLVLYLWKIPLGNADIDESFYLSIPYRMAKGDSLLVHEWHVSQLWSFLIYPIMKTYLAVASGTEGIVLSFRYIYMLIQLTVVAVAYLALRKRYGTLAVAVVTLYGIFSPYDIMACSYNSLGLMMCFLLVFLNLERPEARWRHVLNGLLAAGFVLCNPYMVFLYVVYLMYLIASKDKRALIYTNIGAAGLAAMFFLIVFKNASLSDMLSDFSYALSDSQHQKKTFQDFILPLKDFGNVYFIFIGASALFGVFAYVHRCGRRIWALGLGGVALSMSLYFSLAKTQELGMSMVMFPLTCFGIVLFVMTKAKDWRIFIVGIFVPMMYALCLNLSSNQGMYVIGNACAVSSCATVLLFAGYLRENFKSRKQIAILLAALFLCQASAEVYQKTHHAFWEERVDTLTEEISFGPLKGIKTTEEKKQKHEIVMADIKKIGVSGEENILFYEMMPSAYFVTDAGVGAYSAWTEDLDKLQQYYLVHPEKVPDIVYVFAETYAKYTPAQWTDYCAANGYQIEQTGVGNYVMRKRNDL